MKKSLRTTVVGVFEDREDAQRAVNELRAAGFREDQIGVASHDKSGGDRIEKVEKGTYAEEGAVTGLAAGAGVGALWGLGIMAGLLPGIGPVIAGGTLAAILASAGLGAAAAGLAGALIGLGIPEDEAAYYEGEFKSGRTVVTVKAENRYDEAYAIVRRHGAYDMHNRTAERAATAHGATCATTTTSTAAAAGRPAAGVTTGHAGQTVQLKEEQLKVEKTPVQAGEVRVRKEVHTEHKTIDVPVTKEEVVIERRPASGQHVSAADIKPGEEVRIPVREEQVHVEKQTVVKEEVTVGKRKVQETERVAGEVRTEEVKVEKTGDVEVRDDAKGRKKK